MTSKVDDARVRAAVAATAAAAAPGRSIHFRAFVTWSMPPSPSSSAALLSWTRPREGEPPDDDAVDDDDDDGDDADADADAVGATDEALDRPSSAKGSSSWAQADGALLLIAAATAGVASTSPSSALFCCVRDGRVTQDVRYCARARAGEGEGEAPGQSKGVVDRHTHGWKNLACGTVWSTIPAAKKKGLSYHTSTCYFLAQ